MNGLLNESTVVRENDFEKPDCHEIDYLLDDNIKDCSSKYFHVFENSLVYDIKFTNFSYNEEVIFTITHRSIEFRTEFYGLNKKSKMLEGMVSYLMKW